METNIPLTDPYYYHGSVFDWQYEYSSTPETDLSAEDYDDFVNAILLDEPEPDSVEPPYHLQVQVQGHHPNNNNYADPCNYAAAAQWPNSAVTDLEDYTVNTTTTTVLMEKQPHLDTTEDCVDSHHQISWSEEALAMASAPPLGLGEEPTQMCVGGFEGGTIISSPEEGGDNYYIPEEGTVTMTTETTTLLPSNNNNNAYMNMMQGVESSSSWKEDEDQILKAAIMSSFVHQQQQPYNIPSNWQGIAQAVPWKPPLEVLNRTCNLLQVFHRDLSTLLISSQQQQQVADHLAAASTGLPTMQKLAKRKMPTMWTPEEHKSFLRGIKMFGWGNWKEMDAAKLIPTRTVSQITSHAQKYQKHVMNPNKRRRNTMSIYDITLDNSNSI